MNPPFNHNCPFCGEARGGEVPSSIGGWWLICPRCCVLTTDEGWKSGRTRESNWQPVPQGCLLVIAWEKI